jgi:hypothetical protein
VSYVLCFTASDYPFWYLQGFLTPTQEEEFEDTKGAIMSVVSFYTVISKWRHVIITCIIIVDVIVAVPSF